MRRANPHPPPNFLPHGRCRVIEGRVVDWERLGGGDGRDRDDGGRDWSRLGRALAGAEQEAGRRFGSPCGDPLGRALRQPDGTRCRPAALPRAAERLDMRYQWISRLLANPLIDIGEVMAPFARDVLARASAQAHTLVLIIDQSQVNATHQMVMVSLRVGGRAVPLAWQVKNTQGAIGFAEQRAALDRVAALLPAGVRPVLMGDRFYGSPALIAWCRAQGWDWRLRLKQDLLVFEAGGETTLAACFARGGHLLSDIELTETRVRTNVAMVHEAGPPEPWMIALSQPPSVHRAFDYGLRWGIEAMFSDFKTRGFGLEDSHIARTDRLDRLVLVLSLALYWAVSTGMWDAVANRTPAEKRPRERSAGMLPAA